MYSYNFEILQRGYIECSIAYFIYLTSFALAKEVDCKCDDRGTQIKDEISDGDWCWLQAAPCKLLTNELIPSDWNWVSCVHNGAKQIDCDATSK